MSFRHGEGSEALADARFGPREKRTKRTKFSDMFTSWSPKPANRPSQLKEICKGSVTLDVDR